MAVSFELSEEANDGGEDLHVHDQPLPANNEPSLAEMGVNLRQRPHDSVLPYIILLALTLYLSGLCWEITLIALWFVSYCIIATDENQHPIHRDMNICNHFAEIKPEQESSTSNIQDPASEHLNREPLHESGACSATMKTQRMPITETQLLESVQNCDHAIESAESRGDAPKSNTPSLQKKNANVLNGIVTEQPQQESTLMKASVRSALKSSGERSTSPRQRGQLVTSLQLTTRRLEQALKLQECEHFYEIAKKPEYATETKRLDTFEWWPPDAPVTKKDLAKAGFYYEGHGDSVRCFYCDACLQNWEPGNDPFVEHALRYPKCGYIKQHKGKAFVDVVHKINDDISYKRPITLAKVMEEMDQLSVTESNGIALSSDLILKQLTHQHDTEDETEDAMAASGASYIGALQ